MGPPKIFFVSTALGGQSNESLTFAPVIANVQLVGVRLKQSVNILVGQIDEISGSREGVNFRWFFGILKHPTYGKIWSIRSNR